MSLRPGTRLGPYEVIGPLGAGGMGEVFKARDTRLERSVAIKILPAEFAQKRLIDARVGEEPPAAPLSVVQHFDHELRAALEHNE